MSSWRGLGRCARAGGEERRARREGPLTPCTHHGRVQPPSTLLAHAGALKHTLHATGAGTRSSRPRAGRSSRLLRAGGRAALFSPHCVDSRECSLHMPHAARQTRTRAQQLDMPHGSSSYIVLQPILCVAIREPHYSLWRSLSCMYKIAAIECCGT